MTIEPEDETCLQTLTRLLLGVSMVIVALIALL